jgi:hypothetical protein
MISAKAMGVIAKTKAHSASAPHRIRLAGVRDAAIKPA